MVLTRIAKDEKIHCVFNLSDKTMAYAAPDGAQWRYKIGANIKSVDETGDKLPDAFAEAVQVFYYEGLSGDEAAERLEIQPATLRKRLERARAALHDCLNSET